MVLKVTESSRKLETDSEVYPGSGIEDYLVTQGVKAEGILLFYSDSTVSSHVISLLPSPPISN